MRRLLLLGLLCAGTALAQDDGQCITSSYNLDVLTIEPAPEGCGGEDIMLITLTRRGRWSTVPRLWMNVKHPDAALLLSWFTANMLYKAPLSMTWTTGGDDRRGVLECEEPGGLVRTYHRIKVVDLNLASFYEHAREGE